MAVRGVPGLGCDGACSLALTLSLGVALTLVLALLGDNRAVDARWSG